MSNSNLIISCDGLDCLYVAASMQGRSLVGTKNNPPQSHDGRVHALSPSSNLVTAIPVPANKSELEIYVLLEKANLLSYFETFIKFGADDLKQLIDADEDEFLEIMSLVGMNIKPLHVRRFQRALIEARAKWHMQLQSKIQIQIQSQMQNQHQQSDDENQQDQTSHDIDHGLHFNNPPQHYPSLYMPTTLQLNDDDDDDVEETQEYITQQDDRASSHTERCDDQEQNFLLDDVSESNTPTELPPYSEDDYNMDSDDCSTVDVERV